MGKNKDFDAVRDGFERAKEQFRRQEEKKGGGSGKKAGGIMRADIRKHEKMQ